MAHECTEWCQDGQCPKLARPPLCAECKAAGFGQCNGPHLEALGGVPEMPPIKWCMKHGKFVYPMPCQACGLAERYTIDHGPKVTAEDRRLLMLYGITKAEKAKVLGIQGGVCAGCHRPPVNIALGSDHDHETGDFRGLLCMRCNKILALASDDAETLARLAQYLELYPSEIALGYMPLGRVGRSTRKWKTKREKRERMAWVKERIKALWPRAL